MKKILLIGILNFENYNVTIRCVKSILSQNKQDFLNHNFR